jgi:hypothetical protein
MTYPHVTQFETLDRRRRQTIASADVSTRRAVQPGRRRSVLPLLLRLRRTPRPRAV